MRTLVPTLPRRLPGSANSGFVAGLRASRRRARILPAAAALVLTTCWCAASAASERAAPDRAAVADASTFLPDTVLVAVTLRDGDRCVKALRAYIESSGLLDSELYRRVAQDPGFLQAQIAFTGICVTAGFDPWDAIGTLLGADLTLGAAPSGTGTPDAMLALVARDPAALDRLALVLLTVFGAAGPNAAPETLGDATITRLADRIEIARIGPALLVSNQPAMLRAGIRAHQTGAGRLCDLKTWSSAESHVPKNAFAWAFVDAPRVRDRFQQTRGFEPPAQLPNPLLGLLTGGWWHALRTSETAVAWIEADRGAIRLGARVDTPLPLPASHQGFLARSAAASGWAAESLPNYLGELTVQRDWARLFAERERLLTLPAAGDLVNFANTMTTLMGQLDFMDGFLPRVSGPLRLILTRREFDETSYTPTPKLPAFALVAPLRSGTDEQFERRLQSAAQMALTFLNADAMEKRQPAFMLDVDRYRGIRIVFAEYPRDVAQSDAMSGDTMTPAPSDAASQPDAGGEGGMQGARVVGVRFNFAPAIAVVKDHYVIATTRGALEAVIDRCLDAEPQAGQPAGDRWSLSLRELAALLRENREELVIQNMLEEDHARQQAEGEIDALLGLLSLGERADLSATTRENGFDASITLTLAQAAE